MSNRDHNIKIISYENFPFGGAPANFIRYFALSMALVKADTEVILPTGNVYGNKIESVPEKRGFIENVRYCHLGFTKHPKNFLGKLMDILFGFIYTPIYLIKSHFKDKHYIIILYNTHFTRIFNILLIKKILRVKLILILPEFYEKPKSSLLSLIHWYDFYLGMKWLAKFADGYIPLSSYLQKYLLEELKVKKPIFVLPNLMDPNVFYVENCKPYLNDILTIGYIGTPTRKDGIIDLIESFGILNKKYTNTHLLIIGDVINGNSVLPQLKERAQKLNIGENVSFTGLLPFHKIPDLLNSCQILALTRPNGVFAEAGFPTKLGEYFACRKPVLVTSVGDVKKYFVNEEHVIIANPEDITSIVEGFEKLINNNDLVEKISLNAYKWMNNNLNYRNIAERLYGFIKQV
jgi:glycosyltransferase involved in cell wall biosynthesis